MTVIPKAPEAGSEIPLAVLLINGPGEGQLVNVAAGSTTLVYRAHAPILGMRKAPIGHPYEVAEVEIDQRIYRLGVSPGVIIDQTQTRELIKSSRHVALRWSDASGLTR